MTRNWGMSRWMATTAICALAWGAAAQAADYNEAPMLAAKVAAGQLPPVEERLPAAPLVVTPFEGIGQYGGTMRMRNRDGTDVLAYYRSIGYEELTRWSPAFPDSEFADVVPDTLPNLAERIEFNADSTEFTFHLRPGVKWSDGTPFTADDVMFWYEHVYSNPEIFSTKPTWSTANGAPLKAEKIDDMTFKFVFTAPSGLLLQSLAISARSQETSNLPNHFPRHYLEQFHKAFNPKAEEEAKAAGFESWVQRFHAMDDPWRNPELPTLNPWVTTIGLGQGAGTQLVAERNPYYFKVDPEGNQLPYIDRITFEIVGDDEVTLLKAAAGEYDLLDGYIGFIATAENKGTFFDNQEKGNYHLREVIPDRANLAILSLNLTNPDPVKRELYNKKEFRVALSHAINREELVELVWLGQGAPYQVAERPGSPLFDEEMATQFTEFDPALANKMLDDLGLTQRNAEGIRLMPNGEPLQIVLDIAVVRQPWLDSAELIVGYWKAVGVKLVINAMERSALYERIQSNQHDTTVWSASAGVDTLFDPKFYFPTGWTSFYAVPWGYWFEDPTKGEEPPAEFKRLGDLYRQVLATADVAKRKELMLEVMQGSKELFPVLGLFQPGGEYGIVSNRMRNVPDQTSASTLYTYPGAYNPEQFYIASP